MSIETSHKSSLDANLVNAVVASTMHVMSTIASTEVQCKEVKAQTDYKPCGDISAIINITGHNGEGMLALSFPVQLASIIVSRLIGITPDKLSVEDRCDGVGELVNMISGNTKSKLSEQNNTLYTLSLPTIIQGPKHHVSTRPKNNPYLLMLFEAEGQTFNLQVSFKTF
ncbi:MAG: chemotaxis protein CheX [Cyanobacteria bacterium]|nr:chemotaxis protein CheX [Cyanobacteriota bacterium]